MRFKYPFTRETLDEVRIALRQEGFFRLPSPYGIFAVSLNEKCARSDWVTVFIPLMGGRLCIYVKGDNALGLRFETNDGRFRHEKEFHFFCCNDVSVSIFVASFLNEAKAARDSA